MSTKNAPIKWTNADDGKSIVLTVNVSDLDVEEVGFTADVFRFKATDGANYLYDVTLKLFGDVLGEKMRISPSKQRLQLRVPKVEAKEWPRLTAEKVKCAWITVDFATYRPEESFDKEPTPDPLAGIELAAPYKNFKDLIDPLCNEQVQESMREAEEAKQKMLKRLAELKKANKRKDGA
uniref:CS domain-containing protein n=1 Tax=Steinernema glaseri TaxID=37863 RepID=A0A1I7ZL77_9BILA